jgi:pimeloyl-ACP methyl ester carboxylesterase
MRTRIYGNSGCTAIVLHGGPAATGEAAPIAIGLSTHFVAIEALQRGSGSEPLTVSTHIADIHELVEGLYDYRKPVLVGESWGAMLAICYASVYPQSVAAIVLIGCGTFDKTSRARMKETIESRNDASLRLKIDSLAEEYSVESERILAQRKLMERIYAFDPIPEDEQLELTEPFDLRAHIETWNDMLKMQENGVYPQSFSSIKVPVLMLHGDYDPHPGRMIHMSLKAYMPQIQYRELKNCGHSPWKERQARKEFFMVMTNWLLEHSE